MWNWIALPGLVALVVTWGFAVVVYWARPDRLQNRALALTLIVEGFNHLGGSTFMYLTTDPAKVFAWQVVGVALAGAVMGTYLLFLSTIEAPVMRFARAAWFRAAMVVAAVAVPLLVLWRVDLFVAGVEPFEPYHAWNSVWGPWITPYALTILGGIGVVGLLVSINALLAAAPGTAARRRARYYTAAFAVRDVGYAVSMVVSLVGPPVLGALDGVVLPPLVPILYVPLLAYGILKTQLFDLDLKIKWTLSRGTVAAVFVAVFFIASELAQAVVEDRTGSTFIGVAAAGALVFALAPLQRLADRVSDRALPHVQDTDEYRTVRKREVYRAAVEAALEDGTISEKERDVLATMAEQLGLKPTEARAIEREAAPSKRGRRASA